MCWVPLVGSALGNLLGGLLSDWLSTIYAQKKKPRHTQTSDKHTGNGSDDDGAVVRSAGAGTGTGTGDLSRHCSDESLEGMCAACASVHPVSLTCPLGLTPTPAPGPPATAHDKEKGFNKSAVAHGEDGLSVSMRAAEEGVDSGVVAYGAGGAGNDAAASTAKDTRANVIIKAVKAKISPRASRAAEFLSTAVGKEDEYEWWLSRSMLHHRLHHHKDNDDDDAVSVVGHVPENHCNGRSPYRMLANNDVVDNMNADEGSGIGELPVPVSVQGYLSVVARVDNPLDNPLANDTRRHGDNRKQAYPARLECDTTAGAATTGAGTYIGDPGTTGDLQHRRSILAGLGLFLAAPFVYGAFVAGFPFCFLSMVGSGMVSIYLSICLCVNTSLCGTICA